MVLSWVPPRDIRSARASCSAIHKTVKGYEKPPMTVMFHRHILARRKIRQKRKTIASELVCDGMSATVAHGVVLYNVYQYLRPTQKTHVITALFRELLNKDLIGNKTFQDAWHILATKMFFTMRVGIQEANDGLTRRYQRLGVDVWVSSGIDENLFLCITNRWWEEPLDVDRAFYFNQVSSSIPTELVSACVDKEYSIDEVLHYAFCYIRMTWALQLRKLSRTGRHSWLTLCSLELVPGRGWIFH